MKRLFLALLGALAILAPGLAAAQGRYAVRTVGDVVQLRDARTDTIVSVLTPVSNAYEMVVKGHNIIRMPVKSVDELRANPALNGVPFLAPFANRLDAMAFWANGVKYNFDPELGNLRGPYPLHGILTGTNAWRVVEARADGRSAWVTSRLEFYRYPQYMAQFPFAHTLTMTYRLSGGALEVRTRIDNLSSEPMPVMIGFHPYLQLTDSNRNEWTLSVPAATNWLLDARSRLPTGATQTATTFWGGDPASVPLSRFATRLLDDQFTDLPRDAQGRASVSVSGKAQKITMTLGPKLRGLWVFSTPPRPPPAPGAPPRPAPPPVVPPPSQPVSVGPPIAFSATVGEPAPPERGFVSFEAMAGIANAANAAQKGQYQDLQSVSPGGVWEESFWLTPSGY